MIPAFTSTHVSSLASKAAASNAPLLDPASTNIQDTTSFNGNNVVNHHTPGHSEVSANTEAFYTMGPDAIPTGPPPVSLSPSMSLDSANLFQDLPRYLQAVGGPNNPQSMLAAQVQVEQATLGWTLIGQMSSKAVSGIQTLFNNQV